LSYGATGALLRPTGQTGSGELRRNITSRQVTGGMMA